jgi:hypothetical protein
MVWQWEVECVCDEEGLEAFGLGHSEHGFAEVRSEDGGGGTGSLKGEGEVATACGQIEDSRWKPSRDEARGVTAPQEV